MLIWDRDRPAPDVVLRRQVEALVEPAGPRCLWSHGFIANRVELIVALGLDPEVRDPDLLAALYERHGLAAPCLLTGAVSWIVWDPRQSLLVAVRDRLGIYALYYRVSGRQVTLSPMASSLVFRRETSVLDLQSVALQVQGFPPAAGATLFSGVSSVPDAAVVTFSGDSVSIRRYWRIEATTPLRLRSDEEYGSALRETLSRIVSDYLYPGHFGTTLTSGLDSTSVAATAGRVAPANRMTAFTWIAPRLPDADEAGPARSARTYLGCAGVELDASDHLPLRREPSYHSTLDSPLCTFYGELWDATFEAAQRMRIPLLLSGFGGDHLFGGDVFSYPDLLLTGRWSHLAKTLRSHLHFTRLGPTAFLKTMFLRPFATAWGLHPRSARRPSLPWLGPQLKVPWREAAPHGHRRHWLPGKAQRLETLDDPLLRASAQSLTARAARFQIDFRHPLIDHRLIELATSLPTDQSFRGGVRKGILRSAMRGLLPAEILDRPDKIYPTAIAHEGLARVHTETVVTLLTDMRSEELGFVTGPALRSAYARYRDDESGSGLFWHALSLESWLRQTFS